MLSLQVLATEKSTGKSGKIVGSRSKNLDQNYDTCEKFGCEKNIKCCLKIVGNWLIE